MYEKLSEYPIFMIFAWKINKISKFYIIFAENAQILDNNCPKNILSRFFFGGGEGYVLPCPPVSYAYVFRVVPDLTISNPAGPGRI